VGKKSKWITVPKSVKFKWKKKYNPIISTTKKGITVKSRSEKKLADALTEYDINYIYEKPTEVGTYTFLPDFYLPEFDVYIEYFGITRNKDYKRKTIWKRKMYKEHGYKLISLYPKHVFKGTPDEIIGHVLKGIKTLVKTE